MPKFDPFPGMCQDGRATTFTRPEHRVAAGYNRPRLRLKKAGARAMRVNVVADRPDDEFRSESGSHACVQLPSLHSSPCWPRQRSPRCKIAFSSRRNAWPSGPRCRWSLPASGRRPVRGSVPSWRPSAGWRWPAPRCRIARTTMYWLRCWTSRRAVRASRRLYKGPAAFERRCIPQGPALDHFSAGLHMPNMRPPHALFWSCAALSRPALGPTRGFHHGLTVRRAGGYYPRPAEIRPGASSPGPRGAAFPASRTP